MFNSTIITKKKNLSCGHFDFAFSKGRCKQCATIDSTAKRQALAKEAPKVRKIAVIEQDTDLAQKIATYHAELERWFKARRNEMTGICANCGGKTERNNDKYYKFSIGHILPKRFFRSIATHEKNWLELCHFGNSCHTNYDNSMIDLIELNCFDEVINKFVAMYPDIAIEERRRIPPILFEYLKTEI